MKEMTITFGNDKFIDIEEEKDHVVVRLTKDIIDKVEFIFEDSGIPGVVGPDLYLMGNEIVNRYLKDCETVSKTKKSKKSANDKFDKFKFAQEVAEVINRIYFEKDATKTCDLITKAYNLICAYPDGQTRPFKEAMKIIYDTKKTLAGYKGGFIHEDAERHFVLEILPKFYH